MGRGLALERKNQWGDAWRTVFGLGGGSAGVNGARTLSSRESEKRERYLNLTVKGLFDGKKQGNKRVGKG